MTNLVIGWQPQKRPGEKTWQRPLLEKAGGNCPTTNHKDVMRKLHCSPVSSWSWYHSSGTEGCDHCTIAQQHCDSPCSISGMGGKQESPPQNTTQQEIAWDQLSFCTTQASRDQKDTESRHFLSWRQKEACCLWQLCDPSKLLLWVPRGLGRWCEIMQGTTALLAERPGVVEGRPHSRVRALFCAYSPGTLDNLSASQLLWIQNGNNAYFKGRFEDEMGDIRKCLSLPQGDLGGTNICLLYPWLPILVLLFSH